MLARVARRLTIPRTACAAASNPFKVTARGLAVNSSHREVEQVIPARPKITIAGYLAQRLREAGLTHYFTVPGDFTLSMLDEFLKNDNLTMVGCCNELNAGYAADGYARATGGIGCVMVTYM